MTHAYPPDGQAGVELYTQRLAGLVTARGWRATVVTARVRRGKAQNSCVREIVGGQTVVGLVQNWPRRDLPESVLDPTLDRVFGSVLDADPPDLIAVQTLHGLSFGFLAEAQRRGIPVVWHLHDGGFSCASGGQRRRPDGGLCLPVEFERCGACFDQFRHQEGPLERLGRWAAGRLPDRVPPDLLHRGYLALPDGARRRLAVLNERGGRLRATREQVGRYGERQTADGSAAHGPANGPTANCGAVVDPRIVQRSAIIAGSLAGVRAVLSPSRFLAESLRSDGVPLPPVRVVPSGVPKGATRGPRGQRLRVGFVGTFVPHKGPQVLAAALGQMSSSERGTLDAWAAGPAPYPAFASEVAALARGQLDVRAALAPERVPAALASLDVLVVPSVWAENAPLIVLEARAAGCVVVGTSLGGMPELVEDGSDGLLLAPGDVDALRKTLVGLARAPERLVAFAAAVRERPPATDAEWADAVIAAWDAP